MPLYLARHGKYLTSDIDPEKGLSQYGSEEIKRVAEHIRKYRPLISSIKHSGKKRAFQTAQIYASAFNLENSVQKINGINPQDDVKKFAESIDCSKNEMLVGHLPFMEKLVSYLITNSEENKIIEFFNGTTVCLDRDLREWIIKWAVLPGFE